jgi:general secretion pathway protein I
MKVASDSHLRLRSAFTLIEVMVALGIFFLAVFAILGVMSNGLRNARLLQQKSVDAGMVAAQLSLTNAFEEGLESGDFGDMYPGYTWTRDIAEEGTNGLYRADIIVQRPGGALESKMSVLFYSPQSKSAAARRASSGARGALR